MCQVTGFTAGRISVLLDLCPKPITMIHPPLRHIVALLWESERESEGTFSVLLMHEVV